LVHFKNESTFQVDYGHEEVAVKWGGDPRRFNTQSKEFLVDENGRVSGVKTTLVILLQGILYSGKWPVPQS
jgi:NADPH-dependent glutamate synthase beta subunit-like oxidoreductase